VSQTSKHTIEVEVTVEWDADNHSDYPHRVRIQSLAASGWPKPEGLEALGITRPEPPYVPRIGDIVEVGLDVYADDDAVQVQEFMRVVRVGPHVVSVERPNGDCFGVKLSELTFIARPEVTL
jgi:hypothetical protein